MSDTLAKLDVTEKRSVMLSVRLTHDDAESLRRDADRAGLSVSEFIRTVLVSRNNASSPATDRLPQSSTAVAGGVALVARHARLVPATTGAFVSVLIPG